MRYGEDGSEVSLCFFATVDLRWMKGREERTLHTYVDGDVHIAFYSA